MADIYRAKVEGLHEALYDKHLGAEAMETVRSLIDEIVLKVAERLQCSEKHVRRLIKSGDMPSHRFGSLVRVALDDLRAFEAMRREAPRRK